MEEKWVVSAKRADFAEIGKKFQIDPVIARIIRNRDVIGDKAVREYIHYGSKKLHKIKPIKNQPYFPKPEGGLWASPVDAPFGWKEWCEREHFRKNSEENSFKFLPKQKVNFEAPKNNIRSLKINPFAKPPQ